MDRVSLGKMLILLNGCVFVAAMERAVLASASDGLQSRKENNREFPWEFKD